MSRGYRFSRDCKEGNGDVGILKKALEALGFEQERLGFRKVSDLWRQSMVRANWAERRGRRGREREWTERGEEHDVEASIGG